MKTSPKNTDDIVFPAPVVVSSCSCLSFGLVFPCFFLCVVSCCFSCFVVFLGPNTKTPILAKNGQSRSGQRRSPKFWPQSSIKIGQSRSNFLAKVGFAKVGFAKVGLANVGQIRMAKVSLAKVGHSQPNTLWLEVKHILPWSTEDGSCALGICDCSNEIGRNSWCTLVGLWPHTLDGDKNDPNSLLLAHGMYTWGWYDGPGRTAHNILWGLLCHILSAGTPASACHLTPGHWEPGEELPCDCLQLVPPR